MEKRTGAFRTISEVSLDLDVPQHVLRFWEQKFAQIKPLKRGGGRRYYRPEDVELIRSIRQMLYAEGYTIRGVQRILKVQGVKAVTKAGQGDLQPLLADAEGGAARVPNGYGIASEVLSLEAAPGGPTRAPLEGAQRVERERLATLLDEVRSCMARLRDLSMPGERATEDHSVEAP